MGLAYIIYYFATAGFELNLNIVNFIFLFLGILLHKTPRKFLDAVSAAAKGTSGIILQFSILCWYYGMMTGVSVATGNSLAGVISQAFVSISNENDIPIILIFKCRDR